MSFDSAEKTQTAYNKLKNSTSVEFVEIDEKLKTGIEGEKESKYDSVSVSETELASFLRLQENKKNIVVAVLDTGIDSSIAPEKVIDLGLNYSKTGEKGKIQDDNGHGTELAKLILENANENVKIMPIKVADSSGDSSVYETYLGIKTAIENKADIINISMNSYNTKESKILEEAINKAEENGTKVVVSSGNGKIDTKYAIPSNLEKAIVVSSVAENNLIEKYSNYGDEVDYSAYGMYNGKSGTSYAAARVTGILANAMTKGYSEEILEKYAVDLGEEGKDKYFGKGFIGLTYNDIDEYTIPNDYFESTIFDTDWKSLSQEELDKNIKNSKEIQMAVFLQNLDKENLQEIIEKSEVLNETYNASENETKKYYEYLLETKVQNDLKTQASTIVSFDYAKSTGYFYIDIVGPSGHGTSRFRIKTTISGSGVQSNGHVNSGYQNNVSYVLDTAYGSHANNHEVSIVTDTQTSKMQLGEESISGTATYNIAVFKFKYKKPEYCTCAFERVRYSEAGRFNACEYGQNKNGQATHNDGDNFTTAGWHTVTMCLNLCNLGITYAGQADDAVAYAWGRFTLTNKTATVSLTKGTGIASVSGAGTYSYKDNVTINATLSPGYHWNNWTGSKASTTQKYTFTMPGTNVNNTANGVANTYSIKFNGNGSTSGTMSNLAMTYNTAKNLTANAFKKTGHTFTGWNTAADGSGTNYSNQASVKNLTTTNGGTVNLYAQWRENKLTINYYANGAQKESGTTISNQLLLTSTFDYNGTSFSTYGLPNYDVKGTWALTKTGYNPTKFWHVNSGTAATKINQDTTYATTHDIVNAMGLLSNFNTGDLTVNLYAGWTPISYSISYTLNGGTNGSGNPSSYNIETNTITLANATKTGYTFTGWTGSNGTTAQKGVQITKGSTGNKSYTANFTANTYTIEYYQGSTKLTSSTHTYDQAKALTAYSGTVPAGGWSFYGWGAINNSTTTTRTYTNSQSVTNLATSGTVKLYAIFSRTINVYSGTNKAKNNSVVQYYNPSNTAAAAVTLASPQAISNWTTLGYRTDTTASTSTQAAGSVTPAALTAAPTYYAVYSRSYTAHFYSGVNKGTDKTKASSTAYYNTNTASVPTTVSITTDTAANSTDIANWTELGWRDDTTAGNKEYDYNASVTVAFGTNFYSAYSRTLTVIYNGNGSTGGSTANTTATIYLNANSTTTSTQTVTLRANGYTKTGYTAKSPVWNTAANGSGTNYAASASYNPNVAYNSATFGSTLYAQWEANTYTVAYNGNGATGGSTESSTHTYDVAKNLTANGFERKYTVTYNHNYTGSTNTTKTSTYTFSKWNTAANGSGTNYNNSASVTNLATSGTFNLYAQWTSAAVTYVPTRTGYTFGGWYTESDCTTQKVGTNGSFTPTEDITLYAKWVRNDVTVTINENGANAITTDYSVSLSTSNTSDTETKIVTSSSSTVTFTEVANGTYYIYSGKSSKDKSSRIYSGVSLIVNNNSVSETINYYGLTLEKGTGVTYISNGRINTTEEIQYLYNNTVADRQAIDIGATIDSRYTWSSWTLVSGTNAEIITASTMNQSIKMGAGALTLRADAADITPPRVSITKLNNYEFKWTAVDEIQVESYQITGSSTPPAVDSNNWRECGTTASGTTGPTSEGIYYVWAKDTSGNIGGASIAAYRVTKGNSETGSGLLVSIGGTSLTSGSRITSGSRVVLEGTVVWANAGTDTGYNTPILKVNGVPQESRLYNSTVDKNLVFESSATPNTYKVEYYQGNSTSSGGATKLGESIYTYNQPGNLKTYSGLNGIAPTGWEFDGWTQRDGTNKTNITYTDGQSINNLTNINEDVIKIYAVFKRTIKFNSGENCAETSTAEQKYNPYINTQLTEVTAPPPSRTLPSEYWGVIGYRADKTATSEEYDITFSATNIKPEYNLLDSTTPSGTTLNIYAAYHRLVSMVYNGNGISGGDTEGHTAYQYYNSSNNLSTVTFTTRENGFIKDGYTFSKWAKDSVTGEQVGEGENVQFCPSIDKGGMELVKTMYAIWIDSSNPVVNITKADYNTFTWTATDNEGVVGYQITTSSTKPDVNGTGWTTTGTLTSGNYDINANTANTYYVWVKDAEGNVGSANIKSYKVTKSQGTGTTLTIKENNSSGAALGTTCVLNGTAIYVKASENTGYHGLSLKVAGADFTSGNTKVINAATTVASTATINTYKIEYYQGTTKLGESTHTYGQAKNLSKYETVRGSTAVPNTWTFYGWSKNNGTSDTTRTYTDEQSVNNLTPTNGATIKIYAIFSRTITFKSGINKVTSVNRVQYYNPYATTQVTNVEAPVLANIENWTKLGYRTDLVASTATLDVTISAVNTKPAYNETALTYYGVYSRKYTAHFYSGINKGTDKTKESNITYYNTNAASVPTTVSIVLESAESSTDISSWTELGWRKDEAATVKEYNYEATTTVAFGTNFYSVYSRNLTMAYNGNGATSGETASHTSPQYYNTNGDITSVTFKTAANGFVRTGFTFNKWANDSAAGTQVSSGANAAAFTPEVSKTTAAELTKTMYAIWDDTGVPKVNIIRTDYNTFSWTASDEGGVTGYAITNDDIVPTSWITTGTLTSGTYDIDVNTTKTYYVWAKDNAGNTEKASIVSYKLTKTQGTGTTLTIKENNSSGVALGTTCVLDGTTIYVTASLATGYNGLSLKVAGADFTSENIKVINGNTTVVTSATANTYTISYDGNGATSGNVANQTATYNQTIAISANGFTREGYTFVGWTTKQDGTDDGYNWTGWSGIWEFVNGQNGVDSGKLQLYARWEDKTAPVVTVNRADYNTFNWTATDVVGITGYSVTTTDSEPTSWITSGTLTSGTYDINASTANTYYVWAKDSAGNVGKANITSYKVTKSQGTGTTLTIKENNSSGTALGTTCVLDGTTIYVAASLNTGYNGLSLKVAGTDFTSGNTKVINANTTVVTTATANTYTVKYYNGNTELGSSTHIYNEAKNLTTMVVLGGTDSTYTTFAGWALANNTVTVIHTDGKSVINLSSTNGAEVKLYAVWKRTVNFYSGNSTAAVTKEQFKNTSTYSVSAPAETGLTGWTSIGWRTDLAAGTAGTGLGTATATTITANVGPNFYGVYSREATFYSGINKASGTKKTTQYHNSGSDSVGTYKVTIPAAPTEVKEWTALGWRTDTTAGVAGSGLNKLTGDITVNAGPIFYAVYSKAYTANFFSGVNKATNKPVTGTAYYNTNTVSVPTTISITTKTAANSTDIANWTERGWRDDTETGIKEYNYNQANVEVAIGISNFYSVYSKAYTANFYSGVAHATNTPVTGTSYYNTNTLAVPTEVSITLKSKADSTDIANWTELGWRDDTTDGAKEFDYGAAKSVIIGTSNFYSTYSRNLTVKYNGNGATGGETANTTKTIYLNTNDIATSSQAVTLKENGYIRNGYTPKDPVWNTKADGTGTDYAASASYNPGVAYNAEAFESTVYAIWEDTIAPVVNINRTDYNTFSWTASDEDGVTGYQITTSSTEPDANGTGWITTGTLTSGNYDINANTANTYYVWVKDAAGNVGSANIKSYKVTKSQGTGTTLTIKENNSSGAALGTTCVLNGTAIYVKASENTGYHGLSLKVAGADFTSENTKVINTATTVESTATINTYKVEYYQGTTKLGESTHTYGTAKNLSKYDTVRGSTAAPNTWTFYGWSKNNGTSDTEKTYSDEQSVNNLTPTNGATIKIYAIFTRTINVYSGINRAKNIPQEQRYNPYVNTQVTAITLSTPETISNWIALGYRLDTTSNISTQSIGSVTPAYNETALTYYGVYSRKYTAHFYSGINKGTDKTKESNITYYNTNMANLPTTVSIVLESAEGSTDISSWTELGWRKDETANVKEYNYEATTTVAFGTNFYSVYSRNLTMAYNGNGATSGKTASHTSPQYYNTNGNITSVTFKTAANGFVRTGFTFNKWANDSVAGTQVSAGANAAAFTPEVSKNAAADLTKTMYAIWDENTYNIVFSGNGNTSGTTAGINNVKYTETIELTANGFIKTGYSFRGWSRTINGEKAFDDKENVSMLTEGKGETVTLHAIWEVDTYTLTYDYNGGALPQGKTNPAIYTVETNDFTLENPVKTGYRFIGWTESDTDEPVETKIIEKGIVGNKTLKANYEIDDGQTKELSYTVEYYKANVKVDSDTKVIKKTVQLLAPNTIELDRTLISNNSKYTGYKLDHTDPTNVPETVNNGTVIKVYYIVDDAQTKELSYIVEYYKDGIKITTDTQTEIRTVQVLEPDTISVDKTRINTTNKYTGYRLDEEHTDVPDTVNNGDIIKVYYVHETYTIAYNYNGGALPEGKTNPEEYTVETENFTLENPEKYGYKFIGWTENNADEPEIEKIIEKGTTGNKELTANYEIDETQTKTLSYIVEYYKGETKVDGDTQTETTTVQVLQPNTITVDRTLIENNNKYTGYKLDHTDPSSVGEKVESGTIIKVFYSIDDAQTKELSYTVEYYKDGTKVDGDTQTETKIVQVLQPDTLEVDKTKINTTNKYTGYRLDEEHTNVPDTVNSGDTIKVYYVHETYTITYNYNGGTLPEEKTNPEEYTVETEKFTLENPEKYGYKFIGWTENNADEPEIEKIIEKGTTGNKLLTANYEIDETQTKTLSYTVEYYKDGTKVDGDTQTETKIVQVLQPDTLEVDKTKINTTNKYTGYKLDEEHTNVPDTVNSGTIIKVYYEKENYGYRVEYYYDGSIDSVKTENFSAEYGSTVNTYADKNISGYRLEKVEGMPLTITEIPANNVIKVYYVLDDGNTKTLTYTVEYYKDGTKVDEDTQTETRTVQVLQPDTLEVDKTKINTTNKYTGYKLDEEHTNIPDTVNNGATIKVYYVHETYTITYNYNGGALPEGKTNPEEYTVETENFTLENPEKYGYKFIGWTEDNTDEPEIEKVIEKGTTGNKVLTANYEIDETQTKTLSYTVEYYKGETKVESDTETRNQSVQVLQPDTISIDKTLIENNSKYLGYKLDRTEPTNVGEKVENGTTIKVFYKVDSTQTKELSYTIEYYKDNVKVDTKVVKEVVYVLSEDKLIVDNSLLNDKYLGFKLNKLKSDSLGEILLGNIIKTKSNKSFASNSSSNMIVVQGEKRVLSNIDRTLIVANGDIIKAYYDHDIYFISYDYNGGILPAGKSNPEEYTVEDNITLNNPEKEGYRFIGWTENEGDVPTLNKVIESGTIGDKEFKANYVLDDGQTKELKYMVEYYKNDIKVESDTKTVTKIVHVLEDNTITVDRSLLNDNNKYVGYKLNGIVPENVPDTVTSGTIIKVYYVIDETQTKELSYTVEYYKENELVDSDIVIKKDTVHILEDNLIEVDRSLLNNYSKYSGYKLSSAEPTNVPDYVNTGTIIKVYYEIDASQTKELSYKVEYYKGDDLVLNDTVERIEIVQLLEPNTIEVDRTLLENNNKYTGYKLDHINPESVGEKVESGTTIKVFYSIDSAQTKELSYTVEYYKGNVKVDSDTAIRKETVQVLEPDTISVDNSLIDNNKYIGYKLDRTEPVNIGEKVEDKSIIKIYYALKTYTITYNYDGGSLPEGKTNPEEYTIEDSITIYNPEKEGYKFIGWTENVGDEPEINKVIEPGAMENKDLKANYIIDDGQTKELSYTVEYYKNNVIQDTDIIRKTVQILEPNTIDVDFDISDKYLGFKVFVINLNGELLDTLPDKVNTGDVLKIDYVLDNSQTKEISYTVEYYKDNVLQEQDTFVDREIVHVLDGDTLDVDKARINTENKYTGYTFVRTEPSPIPSIAVNEEVIKVYYERTKYTYKVEYYYGGIKDEGLTETSEAYKGTVISTYKNKPKNGYELDKTEGLPLEISDTEENIIKVYYLPIRKITINHIDVNTNEVLESFVREGKQGTIVRTEARNYSGYSLVQKPDVEEYEFGENDITVNYYYAKVAEGIVEKHIDVINGELLEEELIEGTEGQEYETEEKIIEGYSISTNRRYYTMLSKQNPNFLSENGVSSVEEYLSNNDIDGNAAYIPENKEGTMGVGVLEVDYYYMPKIKLTVKFKDINKEDNNEIPEDGTHASSTIVIEGNLDEPYETNAKVFKQYLRITNNRAYRKYLEIHPEILEEEGVATVEEYLEKENINPNDKYLPSNYKGILNIIDNGDGTYEKDIDVTYYYGVRRGVTIKYIDQITGEEIIAEDIEEGAEGDEYNLANSLKEIEGYTLVEKPETEEGIFKDENVSKTYYYAKNSQVIVEYVDKETGETIDQSKNEIIDGYEGKEYDTLRKSFEGYTYVESTANTSGTMESENIEVIYYYKNNKPLSTNINKDDNTNKINSSNTTGVANTTNTTGKNVNKESKPNNKVTNKNIIQRIAKPNTGDVIPIAVFSIIGVLLIANIAIVIVNEKKVYRLEKHSKKKIWKEVKKGKHSK